MSFTFVKTDVSAPDARLLLGELNDTLIGILGHNGTAHVCLDDFNQDKALFLLGYDGDVPMCCAGIRRLDEHTGEVKRVYARPNHAGIGAALMRALEDYARDLGYRRLVLECREGNGHAIDFYLRVGYHVCAKYPPYEQEADAVCMAKDI